MSSRLRALVLEDEWAARNYLTELLESSQLAAVVAAAADTEHAWAAMTAAEGLDIAFVDIRLAGEPSMNAGMDWLRAARQRASGTKFVLTTASREHAVEAYELGVLDYLVKPFTAERVVSCLHRVLEQHPARAAPSPERPRRIVARGGKNLVFVPLEAVLAFEAAEGLSYVYVAGGRYEVDLSLTALLASLGGEFVRVHRHWLAKLGAVHALERDGGETRLVLGEAPTSTGALRIPVARDRVTQVREALMASSVGVRRVPGT